MANASTGLRFIPIFEHLRSYDRAVLSADLIAGVTTAVVLVPQGMAYALLAGLPPQTGLYASIVPLVLYAVFGTSHALAVGPVALVSLLVANAITPIAAGDPARYGEAALLLALMVGAISAVLSLLRAGFFVNFLSHPVISGFTSAAAITIALTSVRDLLGLELARTDNALETVIALASRLGAADVISALIGIGGIALLAAFKIAPRFVAPSDGRFRLAWLLTRTAPLILVVIATAIVAALSLRGVAVVGEVPTGLPPVTLPPADLDLARALLPSAVLITLVGSLESLSVAMALAAKRRERVEPDREFLALGFANLGAAFTAGFPVSGGFGRSNVNFDAGARTPVAGAFAALFVALTVSFLTPLFHDLPRAALAAIIIVSVAQLVDLGTLKRVWRYDRLDAAALIVTFACVLVFSIEVGIVAGIVTSLSLFLRRTAHPHFAIVGRVGNSEHFRNIKRHKVTTNPSILLIRVDENLYFANARVLEDTVLAHVAENVVVRHVVLICSAVNFIDSSALETLLTLIERLRHAGVTLHLAEIKGPVMDHLKRSTLLAELAPGEIFLSTHEAVTTLESRLSQNMPVE